MSLGLYEFNDMFELPFVAVAEGEGAFLGQSNIGLMRKVLEQSKGPGVGRNCAETLSITDKGLLLLMDNNLGTGVFFQEGWSGSGVVEVGVGDADEADSVLLVGQDLVNGFEQGLDLHRSARVDQEPIMRDITLDEEGGDRNSDAGCN